MKKHAFVELAEVQRITKTMYCAGLDPHPFPGGWQGNFDIYGEALSPEEKNYMEGEVYPFYYNLIKIFTPQHQDAMKFAFTLATVECYMIKIINAMVKKCGVQVFKPQAGFFEQFGPLGYIMLARIKMHTEELERNYGKIIIILDCKRGDIATTQAAYFLGLMGNLFESWGVNYVPFGFEIINVTPWMGLDVMVIGTKEKPGIGLKLMQEGKCIIAVNNTSNPSGPRYQKQIIDDKGTSVQMLNVQDCALLSKEHDLEFAGLSTIGLVVGSTHICDGSIRKAFPGTTMLVPGYGAQGGKFQNVYQELIPSGNEFAGQGQISSLSRASCYPFLIENGGSGKIKNLEEDLIISVSNFRIAEKKAFDDPILKEKGIFYPFN